MIGHIKRSPPYGKRLRTIQSDPGSWSQCRGTSADGAALTVFVIAGEDAFDMAEFLLNLGWPTLAVPPGEDPESFDWSMLSGHDPVILQVVPYNQQVEESVATALILDGCTRVLCIPGGRRYLRGPTGG